MCGPSSGSCRTSSAALAAARCRPLLPECFLCGFGEAQPRSGQAPVAWHLPPRPQLERVWLSRTCNVSLLFLLPLRPAQRWASPWVGALADKFPGHLMEWDRQNAVTQTEHRQWGLRDISAAVAGLCFPLSPPGFCKQEAPPPRCCRPQDPPGTRLNGVLSRRSGRKHPSSLDGEEAVFLCHHGPHQCGLSASLLPSAGPPSSHPGHSWIPHAASQRELFLVKSHPPGPPEWAGADLLRGVR